jgi:trans-aconitate methyltransferase
MKRDMLRQEYDRYYRKNPLKWFLEERDAFTYATLADFLGKAPASLIDVGCGNGHMIPYLHQYWPDTQYTGLDLSAEAIALAKKKAPYATFVQGFLDQVRLGRFEMVLLMGVAEHFEDLQKNLVLVRKLIAPNGYAYIEVPNCIAYAGSEPVEGFRRCAVGSKQWEWHLFRPTWEKHLVKAGFEIVQALTGPNGSPGFIWFVKGS